MRTWPTTMSIRSAHSTRPSVVCPTSTSRAVRNGPVADILVDSDILIDHLRGARRFEPGSDVVRYSVVTRAELYAGHGTDEARVDRLLAAFGELPVDRAIAERAGRLRRDHGLRLPDALIAATAIGSGLALLTRNRRDFESVEELSLA
jgi:predicted nucleic acid-binding protein